MSEIMVPCKKCNNKVPVSSLKMDLDEGKMICPDCIKNKKIHKEIEKEAYHKQDQKMPSQQAPQKRVEDDRPLKSTQKCTSCGYTFKVNFDTKTPKNCPYCNNRVMGF